MAKKSKTNAELQTADQHKSLLTLRAICLVIGSWRKLFSRQQRDILIAEALNNCGLTIAGYLVTGPAVWLVLETSDEPDCAVETFTKQMQITLETYSVQQKRLKLLENAIDKKVIPMELWGELFRRDLFIDYSLVKLITGIRVELPYWDPHLAVLKRNVKRSRFCSAIDYSGADGPVGITKIVRDFEIK